MSKDYKRTSGIRTLTFEAISTCDARKISQTNLSCSEKEAGLCAYRSSGRTHTKDITEAISDATPQTMIVALVSFDPVPPPEPPSVIVLPALCAEII